MQKKKWSTLLWCSRTINILSERLYRIQPCSQNLNGTGEAQQLFGIDPTSFQEWHGGGLMKSASQTKVTQSLFLIELRCCQWNFLYYTHDSIGARASGVDVDF